MFSPRARCFQWRRLVRIITPFEWENAFAHSRSFHALRRFDAAHTTHAVVVCTFASWRAARTSMSSRCFRRASRPPHVEGGAEVAFAVVAGGRPEQLRIVLEPLALAPRGPPRRCATSQNLSAERFAARRGWRRRRGSCAARALRASGGRPPLVRLPYASRARRRVAELRCARCRRRIGSSTGDRLAEELAVRQPEERAARRLHRQRGGPRGGDAVVPGREALQRPGSAFACKAGLWVRVRERCRGAWGGWGTFRRPRCGEESREYGGGGRGGRAAGGRGVGVGSSARRTGAASPSTRTSDAGTAAPPLLAGQLDGVEVAREALGGVHLDQRLIPPPSRPSSPPAARVELVLPCLTLFCFSPLGCTSPT